MPLFVKNKNFLTWPNMTLIDKTQNFMILKNCASFKYWSGDLDGAQLGVDLGTGVVEGRVDGRAVDGRVLAATARAAQLGQVGSSFWVQMRMQKECVSRKRSKCRYLTEKVLEWWNGGMVELLELLELNEMISFWALWSSVSMRAVDFTIR